MDLFRSERSDPEEQTSPGAGSSAREPRIQAPMAAGSWNAFPDKANRTAEVVNFPQSEERLPVWMQRTFLVIYVLFCIEIGMLLTVIPWTRLWTDNALVTGFPTLKMILSHNFVRGMATGIGLLDIWLGIWEAVHYKDHRPTPRPSST